MSGAERIRLEHGSGGALTRELVDELIYPKFRSPHYRTLSDAAELAAPARPCMTTDGFVVDPLFFPGSDIGKLAVFGSCNDLAVCGARPVALSLALILEEGLATDTLEAVLDSIAAACADAGVHVVTGDTKVVPRGAGGGVYITTAAVGEIELDSPLGAERMVAGDLIVLSGSIGAHGIAVLAAREGLPVSRKVVSDCRNLYPACSALYGLGADLRVMRDATRGGVAAIANELVAGRTVSFRMDETLIPVAPPVASAAKLLGLTPLEIANEGVFLAVVSADCGEEAVERLRRNGADPVIVGEVGNAPAGVVVLETAAGGTRIVDLPRGLLLPRIC